MAANHAYSQKLLDTGRELCMNEDLSYEKASEYLNKVEKDLSAQPEETNEVKAGFSYWKKKFDRLKGCKNRGDIAKLLEEFMFKDSEREKYNKNPLEFIQIPMKIFLNAAKNKLFNLPRYYNSPRLAIRDSLGMTTKTDLMQEILDEICMKNGYRSTKDYLVVLGEKV